MHTYIVKFFISIWFIVSLVACQKIHDGYIKPPLVYRITIEQGKILKKEQIQQLHIGMNKEEVKTLLGSPVIVDPFRNNRWDYIYTNLEGKEKQRKQQLITLFFNEDNLLDRVTGDVVPSQYIDPSEEFKEKITTVEVPIKEPDIRTLWGIWDKID